MAPADDRKHPAEPAEEAARAGDAPSEDATGAPAADPAPSADPMLDAAGETADSEASGGTPSDPPVTTPARDDSGPSALRQFLGLFVVPLAVVIVCVGVFVGFGWIAYEKKDASDYLDELQSGWGPRKRQAAYELSKILMVDPTALEDDAGSASQVRSLFADSDDEMIRRYLSLVLGYTRDTEAVPLLADALDDADEQTRIYSLIALGAIGTPETLPPLTGALRDSDPGIRKTAAFALGASGDPQAVPRLEPVLNDPVTDVRWNAALALARLESQAGLPVLERMVDRRLLAQVPEITAEQQEDAMLNAIPAIAALKGDEALPLLDQLAEDDPSLKVRQAALAAKKALAEEG